jgi:hypothetical protein
VFNAPNPDLSGVRPYIKGLVAWLANQTDPPTPDNPLTKFNIGVDYQIDYRECDLASLPNVFMAAGAQADLLFCMSTSVARAADSYVKANPPTTKPIVAIVSDPFSETFGDNVCGASASRDRLVNHALKQFRKKNNNARNIFALHRAGYLPSTKASGWLGKKNVTLLPIADGDSIQTKIQDVLNTNPPIAKLGFLVLPADRFFGAANDIVQWTGAKPTFWTTPDYPAGSFGGYGFAQQLCGQFLAERVASIWTAQDAGAPDPMPDPDWVMIDPQYVSVRPGTLALAKPAKKPAAKKSSAKKPPAKKPAKKSYAKKAPAKRRKK